MREMKTGTRHWKTSFFCPKFHILIKSQTRMLNSIAHIWDFDPNVTIFFRDPRPSSHISGLIGRAFAVGIAIPCQTKACSAAEIKS